MEISRQQKLAVQIVKTLRDAGHTAYFAGGCVRDYLMKRTAEDYDIATSAKPEEVEHLFSKCIPVGKQFGVMIVVHGEFQFEVATFRTEDKYEDGRHPEKVSFSSPELDAKRRDFTVNGLFYDPVSKKVIDFIDGKSDIRKKLIQTIGNPAHRFEEDHLRILRAIRFAANLNFNIEAGTWEAIRKYRKKIHLVSKERVRDELIKMFTRRGAGRGLGLLSESGLLAEILPEIEEMKGVEQPEEFHPEGDVFIHTQLLMEGVSECEKPSVTLAFGALLHDIGKPPTYAKEKGEIHFYNHAHIGAKIAKKLLIRLRFSNKQIEEIVSCVENHMKFANVREMRTGKLKQFLTRPTFLTELELHRIDCMASHKQLDLFRFLKKKLREYKKEELKPKCIVNGHDLLSLGIKAGPLMKEILNEVYVLQLEGQFKDKEAACNWIRENYLTP
jgi:poly(A) polymerase